MAASRLRRRDGCVVVRAELLARWCARIQQRLMQAHEGLKSLSDGARAVVACGGTWHHLF